MAEARRKKVNIEKKREDKKNKLLDSFIVTFAKHGIDNTRVSKLARDARISEGLLYEYFDGIDDILVQCFEKYYTENRNYLKNLISTKKALGLDAIVDATIEHVEKTKDKERFVISVLVSPNRKAAAKIVLEKEKKYMDEQAKFFSEYTGKSMEASKATMHMMNAAITNYYLNQDKEQLLAHIRFLMDM